MYATLATPASSKTTPTSSTRNHSTSAETVLTRRHDGRPSRASKRETDSVIHLDSDSGPEDHVSTSRTHVETKRKRGSTDTSGRHRNSTKRRRSLNLSSEGCSSLGGPAEDIIVIDDD